MYKSQTSTNVPDTNLECIGLSSIAACSFCEDSGDECEDNNDIITRPPGLPWGDQYSLEPFKEGTGQRAIAEMAAEIYDQPALADKGGFFFHLYNTKERVSTHPTPDLSVKCTYSSMYKAILMAFYRIE